MRQQDKEAAAAARELLEADAVREQRATASQSRKASSAAAATTTQKRKATASSVAAAAATEKLGSARAGQLQEQNGGGTPPAMSFSDGSCFFNGAGSFFGGSPIAQQWQIPSDPATWDKNPTPPGGFTNLMQPHVSQNFHFTRGHSHFVPFKPPRAMHEAAEQEHGEEDYI